VLAFTGVWFAGRPVGENEGARGYPELGAPVIVIEIED
jgi:hypothetical protein